MCFVEIFIFIIANLSVSTYTVLLGVNQKPQFYNLINSARGAFINSHKHALNK